MSPGSAGDVPGFEFPAKIAGRNIRVLAGFYRDIVLCIRRDLTSRENRDFVCSSWRGRSGLFHKNVVSLMALVSYSKPMKFNYCLGPPPLRSTYHGTHIMS